MKRLEPRWAVSELDEKIVLLDKRVAFMASYAETAKDIVETMNGNAPNTRAHIVRCLRREANRIYNSQEREYPSNVLDIVADRLADGEDVNLTVSDRPVSDRPVSDRPVSDRPVSGIAAGGVDDAAGRK